MPRGDETGPMGMGAMTGRRAGYCAGFGMPGFANFAPGRGAGMNAGQMRGFGGRRGNRNRFYAASAAGGYDAPYQAVAPGAEKQILKNQVTALQSELDFVKKRLEEIESEKGSAAQ